MKNPNIIPDRNEEDLQYELKLRPQNLGEFIGQKKLKENLKISIEAARQRSEPLDHLLFCGPPGLGKTTLAYLLAREMGVSVRITSGPALERSGDLAAILTDLKEGDILFIDEIHRLNSIIEEKLYPAMEDFSFDMIIGQGPNAKILPLPLKKFTLVGATTRTGLLTSPLRDRFGFISRLEFYSVEDLQIIIERTARILGVGIEPEGSLEIARRCRGTPRIANRLLRRVRDYAQVRANGIIDRPTAMSSLEMLEIDPQGLDAMDRCLLHTIMGKFGGGPVGLETLAAAVNEEEDTIEEVYEPYLIQAGFLDRTPRGRMATKYCFEYFNLPYATGRQAALPI